MRSILLTVALLAVALSITGCATAPPKKETGATEANHPWRELLDHEEKIEAEDEVLLPRG